MKNISKISSELMETENGEISELIDKEMDLLDQCMPDVDKQKAQFEKRPSEWYKARNDRLVLKQKMGGVGSRNSLTIHADMESLGLKDKLKTIKDVCDRLDLIGKKMGYLEDASAGDIGIKDKEGIDGQSRVEEAQG